MEDTLISRAIPALPRRYEDTKPALNQAFTHDAILEIGRQIALKADENKEHHKIISLERCEEEVWEKAEIYKDECVDEALKKAKLKEEKRVKRLVREHEIHLAQEISRVEGITQQRGVERVYDERLRGERKLNELVTKLYSNFEEEKATGVKMARNEEQEIARKEREERMRQHQQAMEDQHSRDEEHELFKLEQLRSSMVKEREQVVEETEIRERQVANERIEQVTGHFNKIIENLYGKIKALQEEQRCTQVALNDMDNLKNSYVAKLKETRKSFVAFAEECRPDFFTGQSDYLISMNVVNPEDEI